MSSMGLSCAYHIQQILQRNQVLQLEDIYRHWHFNLQAVLTIQPLVLDPPEATTRGRPTSRQSPSTYHQNRAAKVWQTALSTRRDLSAFEQIGT